jgi:hypothetical protein
VVLPVRERDAESVRTYSIRVPRRPSTSKDPSFPDVLGLLATSIAVDGITNKKHPIRLWEALGATSSKKALTAVYDLNRRIVYHLAGGAAKRKGAPSNGDTGAAAPNHTGRAKRGNSGAKAAGAKQPPAPAPAKPPRPPAKQPIRLLLDATDEGNMARIVRTTWETSRRVATARLVGGCGATDASMAFVKVETLNGHNLEQDIKKLKAFVGNCEFARLVWSTTTQAPDSADAVASISVLTNVPTTAISEWKLEGCLQYDTCLKCDSNGGKECSCVARGFLAQQKNSTDAGQTCIGMDPR